MPHSVCPRFYMGMLISVAPLIGGSYRLVGADLLNMSFASYFLVLAASLHCFLLLLFVFFLLSDGSLGDQYPFHECYESVHLFPGSVIDWWLRHIL